MQEGAVLSNNYRLERLLGRGGMADVYLAFDIRRQARVAIKVLREDLADDPEFVRRFSREAAALARLEHPNIVRFYAFEQDGVLAFIVMDYVQGTNLQRRLMEARGPWPLAELTNILHGVGSALQYAHREGYVHRDIKPGNIMLREDGTPLLSDFGIARVTESATASTVALGTPAYMSPEQILGHELDRRTDIYSLGIVLYEMATGRRPFTGDERGLTGTGTLARLHEAHLRLVPPHPQVVTPALPIGAAEVILRALAKEPAQRWPDVLSLVQAWEAAVGFKGAEAPWLGALPLGRSGPATPSLARSLPSADKIAPSASARAVTPARGADLALPAEPPSAVSRHSGRRGTPWLAIASVVGIVILVLVLWQVVLPAISSTSQKPTIPAPTADAGGTAVALAATYATATAGSRAAAQAEAQKIALSATEQARATVAAAAPWLTVTAQWETATTQAHATAGAISADRATVTAIAAAAQETPRAAATATAVAGRLADQAATATAAVQVKATAMIQPPTPTSKPQPTQSSKPAVPAQPGVVVDFESDLVWRRGDQPYGQFDRSAEQVHSGGYAGRLRYDFLAVKDNYVVFLPQPAVSLSGQPTGLTVWVNGDGAGHFLNAWVQDAAGEVRSYTFGRITHRGWAQMTAWLDENRGWPNGHISGPDDGKLSYPVSLYALVLDGVPDDQASSGVIYLDDVATTQQAIAQGTSAAPGASPAPATPAAPAPAAGLSGRIVYSIWDATRNLYLLMVRNADGGSPQVVYEGATTPDFCQTPINRIIAKGAKSGVEGTVVIELGGSSREAAPNTKDKLPACSPDGQRVVFETNRETDAMQIWIHRDINIHNDGGSYKLGPTYFGHYPTWSSRWQIIWQGCNFWVGGGSDCGIWQLPDNGQGTPVRVSAGGSDTAPDASPDGSTVAYMSRESGRWQVMVAPTDGGSGRQLTSEGDNGLPTWSPDGRSIAFVSNRDGGWGLWAINADGSSQRKLTPLEPGFGAGSLDWTQQRISWGG